MALHAGRWLLAGGLVGAALLGCATPTRIEWSPDAMREEVRRRSPDVLFEEIVVPFEVEPEPVQKARRVVRGGKFRDAERIIRSASRRRDRPDEVSFDLGFRVARTIK